MTGETYFLEYEGEVPEAVSNIKTVVGIDRIEQGWHTVTGLITSNGISITLLSPHSLETVGRCLAGELEGFVTEHGLEVLDGLRLVGVSYGDEAVAPLEYQQRQFAEALDILGGE